MVNFSAGPPKRGSDFAGATLELGINSSQMLVMPGRDNQMNSLPWNSRMNKLPGNLHTSMKGAKTIVNSNTIKIK